MKSHSAISALVMVALVAGAAAHGGHLHEWPSTPTGSNYLRTKIASCSSWKPGSGTVKYSLTNGTAASRPIVKGEATVWNYLYNNCSLAAGELPSAGVEFNATITQNGRPLSNTTLDGVVMTGSCASGGGAPYYLDLAADPIDDDENMLWFHNFTTNATGLIRGNGANDGNVLTSGPNSIKSVMVVDTATKESLACCDLTLAGPADTNWTAMLDGKGTECEEDAGHSAAAAGNATDPHAGHDMADHDHSMHSMDNGTTAANAGKSAASGAGVISVTGLLVGLVAFMASFAML